MESNLSSRMMSPEEILSQKLIEPSTLNYGLKKRFPDETSDEHVSRLQDDLLKLICYERVEKSVARSQADYNAMTGLIVVTKKLGKWNAHGYRVDNMDCLKYYEALHLIDTNRLELYYDSVLVSLEQAYALLLNNKSDPKLLDKYFIYSNLSKAGYIVQSHRKCIPQCNRTEGMSTADKCVWRCLFDDLKQTTSCNDNSQEVDELHLKIKENMKNIKDAIKNQCPVQVVNSTELESWRNGAVSGKMSKDNPKKRKLDFNSVPSTSKKIPRTEYTTDRFLDVLGYEQEVCDFKAIFDEIQVVQLDVGNDSVTGDIEFDFDLYSPQSGFKQSDPGPPNFRIIILKSNQQPPTRESIVKAFLEISPRAPILVFYVNEFMRVSAFLYRFSL